MGDSRADATDLTERRRAWPLVVRRARPDDEQAILGFASGTWDGWDYIPHAWPVWLTASDGVMLVGCAPDDDRPVAVARVAMISASEAWLEGIRVDPALRGLDIATDMQVAELHWAAAQDATVTRYATGARNEASHRLGARHGFELLFAYRGYWWSPDADSDAREPSAFDPAIRAAATERRAQLLDGLGGLGWLARPTEVGTLWASLSDDATFLAGQRLYEPRPWAMGELTAAAFARHVERGEVIVAGRPSGATGDGWALAILLREQLPGEDSSLRLALLVGDAPRVLELVEQARALAGQTLRFRIPDESPLRTSGHERLLAAGYQSPDWKLHLLGRPMGSAYPIPRLDPARVVLGDRPTRFEP